MSLSFDIERSFTYNEGQEFKMSRLGEQFSLIKDYAFSGLRYINPILQLGPLGGLPTLKSAKTIHFHHMYPICIAPNSMARLAINFSALKILDMKIGSVSSIDRYRGLDPEFRYGMCEIFNLLLLNYDSGNILALICGDRTLMIYRLCSLSSSAGFTSSHSFLATLFG